MINKKRMLKTFLELVKIDSESRKEKKVADYILKKIAKYKLPYKFDKSNKKTGSEIGNLIIYKNFSSKKDTVVLSSHMDTVVPGLGIKPIVKKNHVQSDGNTILGADDKSGLAIIIEVLETFSEKKIPHLNIEAAITTCEEIGLLGAKFLNYKLLKSKSGIVLDSTSPDRLVIKGPSSDYFTITITGIEAHSGINPEKGISSIKVSAEIINKIKIGRIFKDTTLNIGKIKGGSAINIVPGKTEILCEIRSHREKIINNILNKIKKDLLKIEKKYKKINKGFSITMNKERIYDSINISKNELIIKRIMAAAKKNNFKTLPVETGGGADANFFVKNGINTVNLGTGMREFHTKKEKLILKEFYKAGEIVFDTLVDI